MVKESLTFEPSGTYVRNKWRLDWACRGCGRYGNVVIEMMGDEVDKSGAPFPKTDDEDLHRMLTEAHREATSGLCFRPIRQLLIGRMWRWDREVGNRRKMVVMLMKGDEGRAPKSYRWPPWNE